MKKFIPEISILSWANDALSKIKKSPVPRLIPQARSTGFATSYDGTKIFWELHGPPQDITKKTPMVFCYGLSCSMNQWRAQLEYFGSTHPCLLLDYRGHHESEFPKIERHMNISALAKDVAACIGDSKLKGPVHIWGHSMGVLVALELALAEPELCKSLVLLCGTLHDPFTALVRKELSEKLIHPLMKSYHNRIDAFALFWRLLMLQPKIAQQIAHYVGFNGRASLPSDTKAYSLAVANIDPKSFFPLFIQMTESVGLAIAPKVKTPAAVVAGGRDFVTPPSEQQFLAGQLKNSSYIEIPTGSHNVQLDFGEYVALKVEEFWKARGLYD